MLKTVLVETGLDQNELLSEAEQLITKIAELVLEEEQLLYFSAADKCSEEEWEAAQEVARGGNVRGRSFCITKNQRIGNSMHDVKEGDAVVALEGTGKLFILRPCVGKYRLVGDVYIDGLMGGEAYNGIDPDEVDYDIEIINIEFNTPAMKRL